MITLNSCAGNAHQLPEDKISNKEILVLLNIKHQEFSSARKWRPEDFPKVYAVVNQFFIQKEVIEFFGRYGYKPKVTPCKPTLVAEKIR